MLFVISPAKNLNENQTAPVAAYSQPDLLADAAVLMDELRRLAPQDIAKLMHVSDKIALLNAERNAAWQPPFTPENAKQAVFLFNGDVYEGLAAESLPPAGVDYLQAHLRILSGLYGLLRPLDFMRAYRLEMGTALANEQGANLYAFWGETLAAHLNEELSTHRSKHLINLASDEYFKAVSLSTLQYPVIQPVFQDEKNGQYKIISFFAKRARGVMARWVVQHKISKPELLKDFSEEGYRFLEEKKGKHGATQLVFVRDEQKHR